MTNIAVTPKSEDTIATHIDLNIEVSLANFEFGKNFELNPATLIRLQEALKDRGVVIGINNTKATPSEDTVARLLMNTLGSRSIPDSFVMGRLVEKGLRLSYHFSSGEVGQRDAAINKIVIFVPNSDRQNTTQIALTLTGAENRVVNLKIEELKLNGKERGAIKISPIKGEKFNLSKLKSLLIESGAVRSYNLVRNADVIATAITHSLGSTTMPHPITLNAYLNDGIRYGLFAKPSIVGKEPATIKQMTLFVPSKEQQDSTEQSGLGTRQRTATILSIELINGDKTPTVTLSHPSV